MNVKLIISVFVGVFFSRKKNEIDRHSPKIICRQALAAKHDTQKMLHMLIWKWQKPKTKHTQK
jgi:hypothetical protein